MFRPELPPNEPTWVHTQERVCLWIDVGECWETGCGHAFRSVYFEFTFDGIKENEFIFCPYCGGKIEEVQDERED